MKIALYIEDGLEQIVLTPESDTEKGILGKLTDGTRELSVRRGTFYACVGGWTRWGSGSYDGRNRDEQSTMIVLRTASADTHPEGGDAHASPFMSGAVPEGQTPKTPLHPEANHADQ